MLGLILLTAGLAAVIVGAHWLVEGAASLARRFNVSELAIGLTVVAFGTSLPELAVNVFAAIANTPTVAIGNVAGSNIANILLILGISALLCPLAVGVSTVWREIPLALLAAILLGVFASDRLLDGAAQNVLSRAESIAFLAFFAIFLVYTHSISKLGIEPEVVPTLRGGLIKLWLFIGLGLLLLIVGGKATVDGAVRLAQAVGLNEGFIAATLVAVGTSLPELATSAVAAYKKKPDIAVGNIVGSNIFNIFFILGITGLIRPVAVSRPMVWLIWEGVLAVLALGVLTLVGKRYWLQRRDGIILLALYGLFLWFAQS